MNADKHYDTYTGVVGANMFAYCCNNPILFSDTTGEAPLGRTAKVFGTIIPILAVVTLAAYVIVLLPLFSGGQITISFSDAINKVKWYLKQLPAATAAIIAVSIITQIHENELQDIANKYKLWACVEAAKAMAQYLLDKGLEGHIVHLFAVYGDNPHRNIFSISKNCVISTSGHHFGVEYNDKIYCNIHPYGLPAADWLMDFDSIWPIYYEYHPLSWDWEY